MHLRPDVGDRDRNGPDGSAAPTELGRAAPRPADRLSDPSSARSDPYRGPVAFPHPETPRFERPADPDRLFDHEDYQADVLVAAKETARIGGRPLSVSVVLPAKNEEPTVGPIVATLHDRLVEEFPLIDELLVIDDGSTDATAALAAEAGAKVVSADSVLPTYGSGGKGEALWKSLRASRGDIVVWCDADIRNFGERFVLGVIGPLLTRPDIGFVKGFYRRPLNADGEGGGRVTELVARPLIANLFPELSHMVQPLSGEFGGRRQFLEAVPFHRGYAVDLGLLIDLSNRFGAASIGQVDLGTRVHRNRPLRELGPQAAAITAMALERGGLTGGSGESDGDGPAVLTMPRPEFGDATITVGRLPPMASVPH